MGLVIEISILLSFLCLGLAAWCFLEDRSARRRQRLLKRMVGSGTTAVPWPTTMGNRAEGNRWNDRLGRRLGLDRSLAAADVALPARSFIHLCTALGIITGLALVLFGFHLAAPPLAATAALIPAGVLGILRRRREARLVAQLPEAIDMIARAIRAGQSVDAALRDISHNLPAPVGPEIGTVRDEIVMGLSFEQAVRHFEARFARVADVKILCAALVIQRETGGNLTRILGGLAHTIRQRGRLQMQVRAMSAEGRMSSLVLGLIPIAFGAITWLLNPDYIALLFTHPTGKALLALAVGLVGLGFYFLRRIARIEV
jgi:tight adherence protein B